MMHLVFVLITEQSRSNLITPSTTFFMRVFPLDLADGEERRVKSRSSAGIQSFVYKG